MTTQTHFRGRMRKLRQAHGMSQTQLADNVGMQRFSLAKIESGARGISLDEAAAISEALGSSISEMLSENPIQIEVT